MANRKKPSELKVLQGTFRPDRDADVGDLPKFENVDGVPDPPDSCTGVASKFWTHYARQMVRAGMLKQTDLTTLEMFCLAKKRYYDAQMQIDELGPTLVSEKGTVYRNPHYVTQEKASADIAKHGSLLGFSPSARTSLGVGAKAKPGRPEGLAALLPKS